MLIFAKMIVVIIWGRFCCITCNQALQEKIYDSTFYPNLFFMLSAFLVLALVVVVLSYISGKKHARLLIENSSSVLLNPVPLITAAIVLGIGFGGFIDGIVFHQILQWHEMISNKMPPIDLLTKSVNMFWDGIFHAFNLMVVITGVFLLWKLLSRKDIEKSGNLLFGGILRGWGLFNIIEGIINHHLLKLHNVRDAVINKNSWNFGFLLFSVLILITGYALTRKNVLLHSKKRTYNEPDK
jgi:uncharacterized membrane protein